MAGETVDFDAIEQAIRVRLLLARPASGAATLAERLAGGLHVGTPPDNASYPYGAFRIINVRPYPIDAPYFAAEIELQLWFRPRAEMRALRQATDVARSALTTWRGTDARAVGVARVRERDVDILPAFSEGADPEVIASRSSYAAVVFPVPLP